MKLLTSILLNGLIVYFGGWLLSGVSVENYITAIVAALMLGLVNWLVKPILTLLTLPLSILTLGLFLIVINGISVMIASALVAGFTVDSIGWAILFSFVLAIGNFFVNKQSPNKEV